MNDKYLTVSAINKYIKYKLDSDDHLQNVFIKGEISNYKKHPSGHLYFSIKDETSKINAIMFATNTKSLLFEPKDGLNVLIAGRISVYEATGNYQIYVDSMIEDGVGNLYIAFEKLKKDLSNEGLFDDKHKKEIPKYPNKIGIITANTGAVIKDIITTISRRYPVAELILFPSLVQGENAAKDIVKNIELANTFDLDILILARGGGSIEDLWPFNEEIVARSIFSSKIPIISAVGHETDYTIADFVADLRAPTPTAAAELSTPNMEDLKKNLKQITIRLNENIIKRVGFNNLKIEALANSFIIKNPMIIYENKKQTIDLLNYRINEYMHNQINNKQIKMTNLIEQLKLVNPLNILERGYSLVYKDNKLISSIKNLKEKDILKIKLSDGEIEAIVKEEV